MRNRHTVVAALTGLTLLMPAAHLTNAYAVDGAQANDAQGQNASTSANNAPQANKAGVAAPLTQSDVDDAQKTAQEKQQVAQGAKEQLAAKQQQVTQKQAELADAQQKLEGAKEAEEQAKRAEAEKFQQLEQAKQAEKEAQEAVDTKTEAHKQLTEQRTRLVDEQKTALEEAKRKMNEAQDDSIAKERLKNEADAALANYKDKVAKTRKDISSLPGKIIQATGELEQAQIKKLQATLEKQKLEKNGNQHDQNTQTKLATLTKTIAEQEEAIKQKKQIAQALTEQHIEAKDTLQKAETETKKLEQKAQEAQQNYTAANETHNTLTEKLATLKQEQQAALTALDGSIAQAAQELEGLKKTLTEKTGLQEKAQEAHEQAVNNKNKLEQDREVQERALAPLQTAVQEMSKELEQNKQQVQKLEAEAQQAQQHAQQVQQTYTQQQAANKQAQNNAQGNTQAQNPQTGSGTGPTNAPSQPQGSGSAAGSGSGTGQNTPGANAGTGQTSPGANAGTGQSSPGATQNAPGATQNTPQQGDTQTGAANTKPSAPKQPQTNAKDNTMHHTQSLSAGITPPSINANGANAMHANNKRDTMALAAHTQTNYAKDADATSKNANAAMPKTGDSAAVTLALTLFAAGVTTLGARKLYNRNVRKASKNQ